MLASFRVWHDQIAAGDLTTRGLKKVRLRLVHDAEFPPGPERDRLLVAVGDALAERLRCPAELIPGSPLLVPDDLSEIDDGAP